jgi:hypothetical protein
MQISSSLGYYTIIHVEREDEFTLTSSPFFLGQGGRWKQEAT